MIQVNSGTESSFELFVLRLGRGAYLGAALLGALATVGGGIAFLFGIAQQEDSPPPIPAARVAPALTRKTVEDRISRAPDLGKPFSPDDAFRGRLRELPEPLAGLFPSDSYGWDDEFEAFCEAPTEYGCLKQGKRLVKVGLVRQVFSAFNDVPEGDAQEVLGAVIAFLKPLPVPDRGRLLRGAVAAAIAVRKEVEEANEKATAEYQQAKAKHAVKAQATRVARAELFMAAGYLVGSGVAGMVLASLLLALLAIERHLRKLATSEVGPRSGGNLGM